MELYVNGSKLDIQLENEKTVGEVLASFEKQCGENGIATVSIILNGKNIGAEDFDAASKLTLDENTKIELGVVNKLAVKESFAQKKEEAKKISEDLKSISSKFQTGKDNEANAIITSLADFVDSICHTASLSMLFTEDFGSIRIEEKTFTEFFADFSQILHDFEKAIESKDTVLIGDLSEYEIAPRLEQLAQALEVC